MGTLLKPILTQLNISAKDAENMSKKEEQSWLESIGDFLGALLELIESIGELFGG